MKLYRATFALLLGIGVSRVLPAQTKPMAPPSRQQVLTAAKEIMATVGYCTFITIGPDGQPQARVVDAVAPDSGFVVWIGTNHVTRKVADIEKDPRVTLMYFNEAGREYVTLIGKAVVDDDMAHKAAYWKPSWGMMVKDGNRGSDFVLIRVQPSSAVRLGSTLSDSSAIRYAQAESAQNSPTLPENGVRHPDAPIEIETGEACPPAEGDEAVREARCHQERGMACRRHAVRESIDQFETRLPLECGGKWIFAAADRDPELSTMGWNCTANPCPTPAKTLVLAAFLCHCLR